MSLLPPDAGSTQPSTSGGSTPLTKAALDRPGAGIVLPPDGGHVVGAGVLHATLKSAMGPFANLSSFICGVPPGYDVGAHSHSAGEEIFLVLEGELDVMCFEPVDRSPSDWHEWVSPSGQRYLRGGPGAFMHVPVNTPHAFANTSGKPARMFFQSGAPNGHENYFAELAAILLDGGRPDDDTIAQLRRTYDIDQITPLNTDMR